MTRRDDQPEASHATDRSPGTAQQVADLKKRGWVKRLVQLLPNWLTANRVTGLRMLLAVPVAWLVLREQYGWALGVFLGAMALDALDGAIAEARDQHTTLGAFLDPLADKVLVCTVLLAVLPRLDYVLQVPVGCTFRIPVYGICLFAAGLTMARVIKLIWFRESRLPPGHKPPVAAKLAGKAKCWTEVAAVIVLLLWLEFSHVLAIGAALTLLVTAFALGAVSFWSQLSDLWKLKRVGKPAKRPKRAKRAQKPGE